MDADNDLDLDLAIANGRVRKRTGADEIVSGIGQWRRTYAEGNLMMENDGRGRFSNACRGNALCNGDGVSRALLKGDINRDGRLDLLLTNSNGPAQIFLNTSANRHASVAVRAINPRHRRDAIGARIHAKIDGDWYMQPVIHSTGYLSSADATVHFGLASATQVEEFVVIWPDGVRERFAGLQANGRTTLHRGSGQFDPPDAASSLR